MLFGDTRKKRSGYSNRFPSYSISETHPPEMDLVYLTDRIILLWFPETGFDIPDWRELGRKLRTLHGNNFVVFDLTDGKKDWTQLGSQVLEFGWPAGQAPPLQKLCSVCKAVDTWMVSHPKSVVVLYSQGDEGKLGTVISAYLRYTGICSPGDPVADEVSSRLFYRDKLLPRMNPSQKRYVDYLAGLLSGSIKINNECIFLHDIVLHGVPSFEPGGGCRPFFQIYQGTQLICTTTTFCFVSSASRMDVSLNPGVQLHGDVVIECYHGAPAPASRSLIFRIQFHTCTLDSDKLYFSKRELDRANNDFRFPSDGEVELRFGPNRATNKGVTNWDDSRNPLSYWDSSNNFDHLSENVPIIKKESQLDRLLDDMIREIHSISEPTNYRPPTPPSQHSDYGRPGPGRAMISVNGQRRVLSPPDDDEDKPYHARQNCAPFSYGVTPGSPVLQRKFLRPTQSAPETESVPPVGSSPDRNRWEEPDSHMWLQKQRDKLKARKEGKVWEDRQQREQRLMAELRSAHRGKSPENRDQPSSPDGEKDFPDKATRFSTPLHVDVYDGQTYTPPPSHTTAKPPICRGSSAPSSPLLPCRGSSREVTRNRYPQFQSGTTPLTRQKSDTSCDRERPVVWVKRAHQQAKERVDGGQTSPYKVISSSLVYADGHRPDSDDWSTSTREPKSVSPTSSQLDQLEQSLQALVSGSPSTSPTPRAQSTPLKPVTSNQDPSSWSSSITEGGSPSISPPGGDRPPTPSFPVHPGTPYFNHEPSGRTIKSPSTANRDWTPSPASTRPLHQSLPDVSLSAGRPDSPAAHLTQRSSLLSLTEPLEVVHHHPLFVKDTSKFWYKPDISREEAIAMLKDKPPGTFIVRDSNSFPGAFGLALKVATPPPNVHNTSGDPSSELVRHFLIEPTSKGVRLKGCANEPVFGSLSALVYQHSMTPLALPCRLLLPESDPAKQLSDWQPINQPDSSLLTQGAAACNLLYLGTVEVESLTGSAAVERAMTQILERKPPTKANVVHFKVSGQGITMTDNARKSFFRRHYPLASISYCGLDPKNRRWSQIDPDNQIEVDSSRCFGVIAKKSGSKTDNQCHLLAELEKEQPVSAILDFVHKVMNDSRAAKSDAI